MGGVERKRDGWTKVKIKQVQGMKWGRWTYKLVWAMNKE